jgi:hypothetical protein
MDMPKKQLVVEALIDLHRRLTALPTRSHERRMIMQETANLYGVSEQTLYRALAQRARPRALRRSDRGTPRVLPQDKLEYYCELIAAIKVRTSNKKGRHLSTGEAIRLIEEFGVETPDGLIKAQKSMFKTTTVAICGSGAMTTRHCADSRQRSVFKPNTATTAGNST